MASSINASTSGAGGVITTADNTGILNLQTASTTAVTIDASQNVGIGTTSPAYKVDINNAVSRIGDSTGLGFLQLGSSATSSNNFHIGDNAGNFLFYQGNYGAGTERMRIESSGYVRVNNTGGLDGQLAVLAGSYYAGAFSNTDANYPCVYSWNRATSGNNLFYQFFTENPASVRGSIDYNRGAGQVRYNTTSDQRLKENIVDAPSATSLINSIKIRSFDWKETGFHVDYGVIAQELNEVAPDAVSEGLDNEDGTIKQAWGVDTSVLVPALIKTVQEQQTIINDLKARVTALEAK